MKSIEQLGEQPGMLTVKQVAQFLRMHPATVVQHIHNGVFTAVRIGHEFRLDADTLAQEIVALSTRNKKADAEVMTCNDIGREFGLGRLTWSSADPEDAYELATLRRATPEDEADGVPSLRVPFTRGMLNELRLALGIGNADRRFVYDGVHYTVRRVGELPIPQHLLEQ